MSKLLIISGNNGSVIGGGNGQIVAPNPGTLKMHMTGMENFNGASKRGPGGMLLNPNGQPALPVGSGSDSMITNTTMTGSNKSNMRK